ncbi:MAG: Chemotaxis protein CheW [Anaerolineales bacterium]|nr:Chemotaxis protein CheW [Anaerolineales bacterium]
MQTERSLEEEPQRQFIIFRLDETEFAVPIEQVARIVRLAKCTRVPRAPAFLEGVINLHGDVVPIVDLKKRFQLVETPYDDEARIIVAEVTDQRVGLIVDAVTEILWLPTSAIEPPPAMVADISGVYLTGVATQDDRLFVILDLSRVLTTEEVAELETELSVNSGQ